MRTLQSVSSPDEIAALVRRKLEESRQGSLPQLAVILRSSALVHQLRASTGGLTGASFLSPAELAGLVFLAAGARLGSPAGPALAPMIEGLVASAVLENRLCYFKLDQLRTGSGYAEALASTIEELSSAGLAPDDLLASATRIENARSGSGADDTTNSRLRDIAAIWKCLEPVRPSGHCLTIADLLTGAADLLRRRSVLYPFQGSTVAFFDEQTGNAELKFLAAIPGLTAVHFRAFPERKKLQQRLSYAEAVLGLPRGPDPPARPADNGAAPGTPVTEIEILRKRLFHPLGELSGMPPDSVGADGSVHLEEHAGVEEELQSAVEWISRQVLERKVPLERIAVLFPALDPYAFMLLERLAALPLGEPLPVHVATGVPARTQADGSRLLRLLESLEAHLSAESVARLLPYLRLSKKGDDPGDVDNGTAPGRLTFAEALEITYTCGTLGGLAGRAEGALEWPAAMSRRARALKLIVDEQKQGAEGAEESGHARGLSDNARLLARFEALLPAVTDLVELHGRLLRDEPVEALWPAIERFAAERLLLPPAARPVLPALGERLRPLVSGQAPGVAGGPSSPAAALRLSGRPALRVIRKLAAQVRIPVGKLGEPQIYIGPLGSAPGLSFDAVRIMGLCEGAWPARPSVDPILPDIDRALLEPALSSSAAGTRVPDGEALTVPRRDDRPLHQLCDFYRVIQGVRSRLVLSFARQSIDGTIKEPSSVFLEAATALRRPVGGRPSPQVPGLKEIRLGYFGPAREAERNPPPLSALTSALLVAGRPDPARAVLPAAWQPGSPKETPAALDLFRLRDLILADRRPVLGPFDGLLPGGWPLPRLDGLTRDAPLSASRIASFLGCPHRYLFESILHWKEPPGKPLTRELDPLSYGNLLHRVAEKFFTRHGREFCASPRTAAGWSKWRKEARAFADREFTAFLEEYPLLSGRLQDQQRERLRRDFRRFLEFEWGHEPALVFREAEFEFGEAEPVVLSAGGRRIFVHGYIDRLDELDGCLLIRDIKSGKHHPREKKEESPSPGLDVQLVVYALAMNALHRQDPARWPRVGGAAYLYTGPRGPAERAFIEDLDGLLERGSTWLAAVVELIAGRAFPRSLDGDDCGYCPFTPICENQSPDTARAKLEAAGPLVRRFMAIRGADETGANGEGEEPA